MHAQHKHAPTINQMLSFSSSRTHTHHTTTYLIRINDSTLKNREFVARQESNSMVKIFCAARCSTFSGLLGLYRQGAW